jgi:uncharacterized membrane protein
MTRRSAPEELEALGCRPSDRERVDRVEPVRSAPFTPSSRRRRATAAIAVCCAIVLSSGIAGIGRLSARAAAPPEICSGIGNGPRACVAVHGQSVAATLRNDLNVDVCGDFRLSLLRTEGTDDRLPEASEPEWRGCLPAFDSWTVMFPLRPPRLPGSSGSPRLFRFMCVTGYRLVYLRWTETGWACGRSRSAEENL